MDAKNIVQKGIESSFLYLQKEVDTRGYVDGKGWAHSIAHGADFLTTAVMHPYFQPSQFTNALETIRACLLKNGIYMDDEDERLIFAIEALVERGMSEEILENWITSIDHSLDKIFNEYSYTLTFYRRNTNILNFLKSLYFRLSYKEIGLQTRCKIQEVLKKRHDVLYKR